MEQLFGAATSIIIGVGGCLLYFFLSTWCWTSFIPPRAPTISRNINRANAIRPWLFCCRR